MTDSHDTSNIQDPSAGGNGATAAGGFGAAPAQPTITPIAAPPPNASSDLPDGKDGANQAKRPRDARLVHMILASLGITAYQERVPLQLLDFAYRYTSGVLQDALYLNAEGYAAAGLAGSTTGKHNADGASKDSNAVNLTALRLSVGSRQNYQFNSSLPKEFLLEMASERNKVALPSTRQEWGLRLPPEKYCLTGVGWNLKQEWDSDVDVDSMDEDGPEEDHGGSGDEAKPEGDEEGAEDDEESDARMEDIFGDDEPALGEPAGSGGGGGGVEATTAAAESGDREMANS